MRSQLRLHGDRLFVKSQYSPALVDRFRSIPARRWHPDSKEWSFPAVKDVVLMICDVIGELPWMLSEDVKNIAGMNGNHAIQRVSLDESLLANAKFSIEPFHHQRLNIIRLMQNKRWILADEQGTGKTMCVANRVRFSKYPNSSHSHLHQGGNTPTPLDPILIICPKSVLSVWSSELKNCGLASYIITSKMSLDTTGMPALAITNYERVREDFHEFYRGGWNTVILDEVHRVKNFTSQISRCIRKLTEKAEYVYGLSGTPAPNGLEDWFGVLSAVDPTLLPVRTKTGFEARYCVKSRVEFDDKGGQTQKKASYYKTTGYRNVSELHEFISKITSRVTKKECLDLPDKIYCPRKVPLQGEQRRIYQELKKQAVARLSALGEEITVNNVLTESLRLLQVVGGFVPDDNGKLHETKEKAKIDALGDIIDESGDTPKVIWCCFKPEVDFIRDWLYSNYKARVAVLTGDTPQSVREETISKFQNGEYDYFIGTAQAGGIGITLTAADTEIYYSRNWNLADYLQSQDRLHRIGQKNNVSVYKIIAQDTVDEKVDIVLDKKADLQEMMLKNPEVFF